MFLLWLKKTELTDIQVKTILVTALEYEAMGAEIFKTKWIPGKINSKPELLTNCPSYYK
jgi:hypothetical protein